MYTLVVTSKEDGSNIVANKEAAAANSERSNEEALKTSVIINGLRSDFYGPSNFTGNVVNSGNSTGNVGQQYVPAISNQSLRTNVTDINLSLVVQGGAADGSDIVVIVGGNTILYDAANISGWKWNNAGRTQIRLPISRVTGDEWDTDDGDDSGIDWSRSSVSISKIIAGQDVTSGYKVGLTPVGFSNEPYFIITSNSGSDFGDFNVIATDDDGGNNLRVFKGVVKSFTDLPSACVDGYQLQVSGDNNKKEDNFYVKFNGGSGGGYWKETVGDGLKNDFNLATMPHTLKQQVNDNGDLYFTFTQGRDTYGETWASRKAGDDDTNPFPSFVGDSDSPSYINDIFFHRNRLGIISGENVIFSETSNFFNFFRTTVRALLDSDPIDVAVSQNEVSELKAALPIQDSLLLFSELTQFTLSASQLLTPAEVTIDQSTKFECDLSAAPVGAGNSVFFAVQNGVYAGVREYFTEGDTEIKDATLVTSHVPKYLQGNIRKMTASTNEDMLICLASSNKKEAYVYKWYNSANERLQSSWSKWVFDSDVADVTFNNSTMYITFTNGSHERLDLSPVSVESVVSLNNEVVGSGIAFETFTSVTIGTVGGDSWYGSMFIRPDPSLSLTNDNIMTVRWNATQSYLEIKIDDEWDYHTSFTHYNIGSLQLSVDDAEVTDTFIFTPAKNYKWSLSAEQLSVLNNLTTVNHGFVLNGNDTAGTTTQEAAKFNAYLDHRVRIEAPTLGGSVTSISSAYTPTPATEYVDYRGKIVSKGNSPEALSKVYAALTNSTHLEDGAEVNDYLYVGEPYTFKYQLSEQVFSPQQGDTTDLSRFQLRTVSFNYNDTGSFEVTSKSTGRDAKVANFTGRILGQVDNVLGYSAVVESGSFTVGVQGQAKETAITITNSTHLPSTFQSAEWEGYVVLRNQRL